MVKLYKLCFLLFLPLAHASCNKLPGTTVCENGIESSMSANGNVILNHMQIDGITNIKGQLFVQDSKLMQLDMFGFLKAQNTIFHGPVSIWANQANLIGGSAESIRISSNSGAAASLTLSGGVVINGDISFSDKQGVVLADNTVELRGKVIGGVIKRSKI